MPFWFNQYLKTKFDLELSRDGFNFVKDLFPGTQLISMEDEVLLASEQWNVVVL